MISKYHNFEACEKTRGVDPLFYRYKKDRKTIIFLVENDPNRLIETIWKKEGILAIDNECLCRMGTGDIRTEYACAQCKNIRRLTDFKKGGIDKEFKIECGSLAGTKLIVNSYDIKNVYLKWEPDITKKARNFAIKYNKLSICGTPNIENIKTISGDNFTIRTIILWMISKLFNEKKLPHCPLMYSSFICRGKGYSVNEFSNELKVEDINFNSKINKSIITQILVILTELKKINFSHGNPSVKSLIFKKEPVSYKYNKIHVNSSITVQITNFWNSSATFNNVHYFSNSMKSLLYLEKELFTPDITVEYSSMAYCIQNKLNDSFCKPKRIAFYKLTQDTLEIYNAMRHIGFPLYVGSFDFYCFMVSLMCNKNFYDAMDEPLFKLWSMMWLIDDFPRIQNMIKDAHKLEKIKNETIINIIRDARLRCDIVEFIWELL